MAELDIFQVKKFLEAKSGTLRIEALLLDRHKDIIASTSPNFLSGKRFDPQEGGELRPFKVGQTQWFPKMEGASLMTRWRKSYYLQQVAIGGEIPWDLVVRFSPVAYIEILEKLHIYILALILVIILPATIVANALSLLLVKPIAKLIRLTTDLPQNLSVESDFVWQSSNLAEIDALGYNFQVMAIALREQFHEIEQTNQNLEIRIQERTAELIKSEERWQLAIQAAGDGIWDWNIETGVIFRSIRWRTMLGMNPEVDNEQPLDWLDLIHPEDRDRILQLQEDYFTKKTTQYIAEYRMRCQDGSYKWILTQAMAIWNDEGKAIRLVGANNDITDRELAKMEILQAMEAAQSANRAKSEFLATMSHEIRTPMNAVIGFTSLLLDTNIDAEQREFMEIIRLSGDNLLTIINDILDFSKIESGQFRLDAHPFNLRHCIEESLDLLASVAATKRIELAYCIDPEVPEWIVSDITRLRQILVNLFSNAVKFTSQGAVTVRVSVQQFDDRNQNYQLLFSVKDTGIGIPVDRYDRLFKPFSQVDSSTTRQYGGTGLGLAIANHLTLLMGGNMSVESVVGVGSTFSFTISTIAEIANQTYLVREEWNQSLIGKRILILEDNDVSQESITTFAQILKMEVMATSSSEQAIAWLESEKKFDLAIVDASIPITMLEGNASSDKPDNYDIRHLIRIQSSLLPMILLSHTSNCDLFTSDPITICLSKPIKRSQLYKSILKLCSDQSLVKSQSKQKDNNLFDEKFASKFPLRILLAEDNIVNQKVAIRFLNRLGYRVDVVANGIEAIESIYRQDYDVILMDVHMPEMDGLTATRRIIAEFTKQKPWIIALTANALEGDRKICLEAGMQDYVSKPIQVQELIQALEQAFNNRHQ
jgi:PAS domain S-box-containing protein